MSENGAFKDKKGQIVGRGRPFVKMHGLRNDFIIVDGRDCLYEPSTEAIARICDRRAGVGVHALPDRADRRWFDRHGRGDEHVEVAPELGGERAGLLLQGHLGA